MFVDILGLAVFQVFAVLLGLPVCPVLLGLPTFLGVASCQPPRFVGIRGIFVGTLGCDIGLPVLPVLLGLPVLL